MEVKNIFEKIEQEWKQVANEVKLNAAKKGGTVFVPLQVKFWQQQIGRTLYPYELEVYFGKSHNKISLKDCPGAALKIRNMILNVCKECGGQARSEYNYVQSIAIPTGATFFTKPTKEFNALQAFLKRRGITIKVDDLWSADIYGKRGHFDTERNRKYVAYNKEQCADILRWLKFYVGHTGKLTAEIKVEDTADENEMYISRYQETECEGTRYRYLYMKVQRKNIVTLARSFDSALLWLLQK